MKRFAFALLGFALTLSLNVSGHCLTGSIIGTKVVVEYQEPNVNEDSSPLADLAKTVIHVQTQGSQAVTTTDVPATAKSGDGQISQEITIPSVTGQEFNIDLWATAFDESGNESAKSNTITIRIDKLAPAAPR